MISGIVKVSASVVSLEAGGRGWNLIQVPRPKPHSVILSNCFDGSNSCLIVLKWPMFLVRYSVTLRAGLHDPAHHSTLIWMLSYSGMLLLFILTGTCFIYRTELSLTYMELNYLPTFSLIILIHLFFSICAWLLYLGQGARVCVFLQLIYRSQQVFPVCSKRL